MEKNQFKEKLEKELMKDFLYKKVPLFNGDKNPETGKKEFLHVLSSKTGNTHFSCLEEVEENKNGKN